MYDVNKFDRCVSTFRSEIAECGGTWIRGVEKRASEGGEEVSGVISVHKAMCDVTAR